MKIRIFWVVFTALLLLVTYAWVSTAHFGPLDIFYIRLANQFFAVLGVVFIFMQFVLSARIKTLEEGFGLDKMLHYHRYFGRAGLIFLALHGLLYIIYELLEFGGVSTHFYFWLGIIAFIGFLITASLAVLYKRIGITYEAWKNIHLFNYVLFPLALIHVFYNASTGTLLYYLWIAFAVAYALIILYRVYQIYRMRSNPYQVIEVKQEAEDIWTVSFKGREFSYKPGQFLMMQLLRDGVLSPSHPFTLSSSPTWDHISITPKESGDFTATIKETKVGDKAFIDAPYGVFSFLNYDAHELVFIAGGIGITPFMSMLRYISEKQLPLEVTLFWGNKDESSLCFQEELEMFQEKMHNFSSILIMSKQKNWPGEQGRINAQLIQKYLPDLEGKDFFVCGPPAMSNAVMAELQKIKVPASKIHRELFDF